MADGHFNDVELLRRELAILILEWAGKAAKDDPDGPMSTALTRAVSEAARDAVAEQHQALTAEAADRIAEAIERRGKRWSIPVWAAGLFAAATFTLLTVAFLLGLQIGRSENALPTAPVTAGTAGQIAPLAPTVEEPRPSALPSRAAAPVPQTHVQRATPRAESSPQRPRPRDLGRPAPASSDAPTSSQPVDAAPPSASPVTKP